MVLSGGKLVGRSIQSGLLALERLKGAVRLGLTVNEHSRCRTEIRPADSVGADRCGGGVFE